MKRIMTATALFLAFLCSCEAGDIGTGVANPPAPTSTGKAAAVISAIFATEDEGASLTAPLSRGASPDGDASYQEGQDYYDNRDCGEDDPECTCAEVMGELEYTGGPDGILMNAFGDTGFYGSIVYGVELIATDFCAQPDGTENPGLGSDGKGRFATFELISDVAGVCRGGEEETDFAMGTGSTGVWRNTEESETEPAYAPEIYGSFTFLINGEEEITLDCTIFLDANEGPDDTEDVIAFADCSDENGESVEQDTDQECEFNAE